MFHNLSGPDVIKRFCVGHAVDGNKLRSIIKYATDGKECDVQGWTTYMLFYAFDYMYGVQQELCLFACGEVWSPVHRGMMSISNKNGDDFALDDLKAGGWNIALYDMMEESLYSDPIDIMWAFNDYHRLLLNIVNDPLDYHNEPTLHGWASSGRIFHSIMAVKYNNNNHHIKYHADKPPTMYISRHTELRKRGVNKDQNISKAGGKMLHALSRFLTLWTWSSVTTEMVQGANSLYGGNANANRNAEREYIANINNYIRISAAGSVRIDAQSGIMTYPEYPGLRFANIQIQYGVDTYARIELPIGIEIGARRIRHAFLEALMNAPHSVRIVPRNGMEEVNRMRRQPLAINWIINIIFVAITIAGPSNTKGKGNGS